VQYAASCSAVGDAMSAQKILEMQNTINKLHEQNQELRFRAENPSEPGRADSWQAACGIARRKLVDSEKELDSVRALLSEVLKEAEDWHDEARGKPLMSEVALRARDYLDACETLGEKK